MRNLRRQYPELSEAFDLYQMCRTQVLVHIRMEKDRGKRVEHKVLRWPTGYHTLPESGGLLDQPHRLMDMFHVFMNGERLAAVSELQK